VTAGTVAYARLATPVGPIVVAGSSAGVVAVQFVRGRRPRRIDPSWRLVDPEDLDAAVQLREYFAGERRTFDLPLTPQGTPFQRRVWDAVAAIPFGTTQSYGAVAAAIGAPSAVRAVGAANGQNPWPIIVPCHRVIGGDGSLTGYGGGLPVKQTLLEFERGIPWRGPAAPLFADAATS
jgi:methylated-DNA-[protein]-cysteine S-methyltransferase